MTAGFNIIFDRMKESFVFCIPLQILLGHLNQVGWSEQNLQHVWESKRFSGLKPCIIRRNGSPSHICENGFKKFLKSEKMGEQDSIYLSVEK